MKRIICIILCIAVFALSLTSCGTDDKDAAIATAEEFARLLLTSDSARYEEFLSSELYNDENYNRDNAGYELFYMYLPQYTDICTDTATDLLCRINFSDNATTADRYAYHKGYDSIYPTEITSSVTEESENQYFIRSEIVLGMKKGDLEGKDYASLRIRIDKDTGKVHLYELGGVLATLYVADEK
ncbi:MAG: hypothetical protein E7218_08090 [Anaerofustis stercorihominis]|nr:hypothetical protein [Anaerofustis stercorihominis]